MRRKLGQIRKILVMTIKIVVEFNCKNGKTDEFISICKTTMPETRLYDGCESLDISVDQDDFNHLIMTEEWVSKKHHQSYMEFRKKDGISDALQKLQSNEPKLYYLDMVEA